MGISIISGLHAAAYPKPTTHLFNIQLQRSLFRSVGILFFFSVIGISRDEILANLTRSYSRLRGAHA